jgi:hypothetical protein
MVRGFRYANDSRVRCDTYARLYTFYPWTRVEPEALQMMNLLSGGVGTMQANQRSNLTAKTIHSDQYCKSRVDAEHVDD